jgi:hypothetical protein
MFESIPSGCGALGLLKRTYSVVFGCGCGGCCGGCVCCCCGRGCGWGLFCRFFLLLMKTIKRMSPTPIKSAIIPTTTPTTTKFQSNTQKQKLIEY